MPNTYSTLFKHIEYLEQLWDNPIIGFALIGTDDKFMDVNQTYLKIIERKREHVIGTSWKDLTIDEDIEEDAYLAIGVLQNKLRQFQLKKCYKLPDDSIVEVLIGVKALRDTSGKFICFYVSCIPMDLILDRSDLVIQYKSQSPVLSSDWDRRITNTYRIIGIVIGAGVVTSAVGTALYWFVKIIDRVIAALGAMK